MDFRKSLPFKSYGEKKPIYKLVRAPCEQFSRTFWTTDTQDLLEAQPVSQILLQTLATSAAGVKKAAALTASYLRACANFHPRMRFILQYMLALSITLHCVYGHTVYTHHTHPVQGPGTMGVHLDAWKCTGNMMHSVPSACI